MVRGSDHCPPLRIEYFKTSDSTQLSSGLPSCVTDQFTCELPGPVELAAGSTFKICPGKVWPNNNAASIAGNKKIIFLMEVLLHDISIRELERNLNQARRLGLDHLAE